MATANVNPAPAPEVEEIEVSRNVLSLETFTDVKLTGTVKHRPVSSIEEFLSRFESTEAALKACNLGLRRDTVLSARLTLGTDNPMYVSNSKPVAAFLSAFAMIPPHVSITDKKAKRRSILAAIAKQPALLEALKSVAAQDTGEEDETPADE